MHLSKSLLILVSAIFSIFVLTDVSQGFQGDSPKTPGQEEKVATPDFSNWIVIEPTGALATFEMPKKPRYVERSFAPVKGRPPIKVHLHIATSKDKQSSYIFSYHKMLAPPKTVDAKRKTLDGAMLGSVTTVDGQLVTKPDEIVLQDGKHPGRRFLYMYEQNDRSFVVLSRVYLVGSRQYQLSTVVRGDVWTAREAMAAKFVNSFQLVKPESDLPPVPRKKQR